MIEYRIWNDIDKFWLTYPIEDKDEALRMISGFDRRFVVIKTREVTEWETM